LIESNIIFYQSHCFKQNPIIEDDSDSYREYTDGDNNLYILVI